MANIIQHSPLFNRLARFDPFRDEDWLRGLGIRPFPFNGDQETSPQIKIDLVENDNEYSVRAEIPGVRKEDINVSVEGSRVSISAEAMQEKKEMKGGKAIWCECSHGASYRCFTLDSEVDETKAEASYENGVLELTLPKKTGGTAKHLQVK